MSMEEQGSVLKWILGFVGMLLILAACSEPSGAGEDTELLPIQEGVRFTVKETHDQRQAINVAVEPFIQLEMETEDIFNCGGFMIVSDLSDLQSNLLVDIKGIAEPDGFCTTALSPASNRFSLDLASGEYDLNFAYDDNLSPFRLTVTDSSLEVSSDDTSFVAPDIQTFWRFPQQSFVYLCRSTPETSRMCNDFEQLLIDSLAVTEFSFPNHGTKPYPEEGKIYDIATYFRYPEEPVFLDAGEMLEAFADSVIDGEDPLMSVISWKNQGFRSWTDVGE